MAGIGTIIGGIGSAVSAGSSLFGSKPKGNPQAEMLQTLVALQENQARQTQMNLDATRRKRDIIRQAQVATGNAEAIAANQGAINSSSIEGARSSISGQAGVNYLGVSQNQEIGNKIFQLETIKAMALAMQKQSESSSNTSSMFGKIGGALTGMSDTVGKIAPTIGSWGSGAFSSIG